MRVYPWLMLLLIGASLSACQKDKPGQPDIRIGVGSTEEITLARALEAERERFRAHTPRREVELYERSIAHLSKSGILEGAIQLGDLAPDFTLPNATGMSVRLSELTRQGPVVLTWYRGGWCPYCNINLQYLQRHLPAFRAEGATLIALSPEVPDSTLSTKERNGLQFEVLSDPDNQVAKAYGLVYRLTPTVAAADRKHCDLAAYNGNTHQELPLAATYVLDRYGRVSWAFVDADYRKRAEPQDIVAALKKLDE
ncbi:MAG: peroxiredoxin-like family protein [Sphingobacteriia bacterium]